MMNEADTRAKLIDPVLHKSGWSEERIARDIPITPGRIIDDEGSRRKGKKPDYILHYSSSLPIAVVEAKEEGKSALAGMQQAKDYARDLDVLFVYSTNGHGIEEFDFITNKQRTVPRYPTPDELWERYAGYRLKHIKGKPGKNPLTIDYHHTPRGKKPWYYQGVAIKNVIENVLQGKRRILITMATGSGKTYVSFQTVWKLYQSGMIRRVLYIADRIRLRDQAYNEFGPFGDARAIIGEQETPKTRDIYFTTYQSLYSGEEGKRIYEQYDRNFFDMIIIDECHRSGFGTWHDILKHFSNAVHFGMTATPKRDDNIDTYAYFGTPAYSYSMGRGIDDGFLPPYRIHKVFTNIDREGGLSLTDIETEGAKVYTPENVTIKEYYTTGEFEKEITLPDRTRKICEHLSKLLRILEPLQKTMIFCVSNEHAALVARELQNHFSDLGYSDYAVRIVSEESEVRTVLERFADSDKTTPVIATTVDLLTTGVDVPSVHNIVILRPIASRVLFKQIVGRGSRVDPNTDKYYFRIIDYMNATRLFDEWDYPEEIETGIGREGPRDWFLTGKVVDMETGQSIAGARVVVYLGKNEQTQTRTGEDGKFSFSNVPRGSVKTRVNANGYIRRDLEVETSEDTKSPVVIELKRQLPEKEIVKVEGLNVYISEETYVEVKEGTLLTKAKYIRYSHDEVRKQVVTLDDLRRVWINSDERKKFLEELKEKSVNPEVIARMLERPDADTFDVLAHIAFGAPIITRDERARALENLKSGFLESFGETANEVLLELLEKYRIAGVEEISRPEVFSVPPFDRRGYIMGVAKLFGGMDRLKDAIDDVQKGLYPEFSEAGVT